MQERAYRIYITDALRAISGNTAHIHGGEIMQRRWIDVIEREEPIEEDPRSIQEIAHDIWCRMGM